MNKSRHEVAIFGNPITLELLARFRAPMSRVEPPLIVCEESGGAALLFRLLNHCLGDEATIRWHQTESLNSGSQGTVGRRTYFRVAQFESDTGNRKIGHGKWRVRDCLGMTSTTYRDGDITTTTAGLDEGYVRLAIFDDRVTPATRSDLLRIMHKGPARDVIVNGTSSDTIILGELVEAAVTCGHTVTVVCMADDLRRAGLSIGRNTSWEHVIEDIVDGIHDLQGLTACAHVIVLFEDCGAVILSPRSEEISVSVCYHSNVPPGAALSENQGSMPGLTQCVIAGLAFAIIHASTDIKIQDAVCAGLGCAAAAQYAGFGAVGTPSAESPRDLSLTALQFPVGFSADILRSMATRCNGETAFDMVIQSTALALGRKPNAWTLLGERYPNGTIFDLAHSIVMSGPSNQAWDVPIARLGSFITVDRWEIEACLGMQAKFRDYLQSANSGRAFSIAVFGAPGTGRTFAVSSIARSLERESRVTSISFNVLQFTSLDQLYGAFRQIQEISLQGFVPLVFWEGFDSEYQGRIFGWLRYFLEVMNSGKFQDGATTSTIGRAIFAFVSTIHSSMQSFQAAMLENKIAHGIDFLGLLEGYLDVPGIGLRDAVEPAVIIRRAILLHAFIMEAGGKFVELDRNVVDAFLKIRQYRYGARSMRSIVRMSGLERTGRLDRSTLPTIDQIELHVDARDFILIVDAVR